jgi:hypothetical protein
MNIDMWSFEAPPREFSSKRQKMDPEIIEKIN